MRSKLAVFRPVAYKGLSVRNQRRAAVLHTNGGPASVASLFGWFSEVAAGKHDPPVGPHTGAHFQIGFDGKIEQYVDTDLAVGHAFAANSFAVGIETQDGGERHEGPWTPAQLDSIVALLKELQVPPVLLRETASDGVGWHSMHSSFNEHRHDCPTSTRVDQIKRIIIPRLKGEEEWMASQDEFDKFHAASHGVQVDNLKNIGNSAIALMRAALGLARPATDDTRQKIYDFVKSLVNR